MADASSAARLRRLALALATLAALGSASPVSPQPPQRGDEFRGRATPDSPEYYGGDAECGGRDRRYYDRLYGVAAQVLTIEQAGLEYRRGRVITCGSCRGKEICWLKDGAGGHAPGGDGGAAAAVPGPTGPNFADSNANARRSCEMILRQDGNVNRRPSCGPLLAQARPDPVFRPGTATLEEDPKGSAGNPLVGQAKGDHPYVPGDTHYQTPVPIYPARRTPTVRGSAGGGALFGGTNAGGGRYNLVGTCRITARREGARLRSNKVQVQVDPTLHHVENPPRDFTINVVLGGRTPTYRAVKGHLTDDRTFACTAVSYDGRNFIEVSGFTALTPQARP